MAVSQIEEKILGRLAKQAAPTNPLLSSSLYQVLGLSILLSRKLYRARKLRRLDITRDTKSLQLYHQIIWLAREGLSITEVYILPYCQNGEQGPECRVMAAKLRASLYHIFCLFHNNPPIGQASPRSSPKGSSSSSNGRSPKGKEKEERSSPKAKTRSESGRRRRRKSKQALRDPIPSMNSDTSYVTNPYAPTTTPPPSQPNDTRKTPTRPPGLSPINVAPAQAAASFLLPPLDFVPMTGEYFATAQNLANRLLHAAHALRLSISLEHAAFTWECMKEHDQARQMARSAIVSVYSSTEGLDDDEYADAVPFVQALGGIYRRGSNDSTPRRSRASPPSDPPSRPAPTPPRIAPPIDRTIALSPSYNRRIRSPAQLRSATRTPERLSTVPEDPSQETLQTAPTTLSPSASRTSTRSKPRRGSSASDGSDKAAKRKAAEQAEALYRQNSAKSAASQHSRQNTPPDGQSRSKSNPTKQASPRRRTSPETKQVLKRHDSAKSEKHDKRQAVLTALNIISFVKRGATSRRSHGAGIAL